MVVLTFQNIVANESLQIGDLVYYIQNLNTNYEGSGYMTGDAAVDTTTTDLEPVSTMVLVGTVSSIQYKYDDIVQSAYQSETTEWQLLVYVEEPSSGVVPPGVNDFIFFVKDDAVEKSSIPGYYASITMKNNTTKKAELYMGSCEVAESSK